MAAPSKADSPDRAAGSKISRAMNSVVSKVAVKGSAGTIRVASSADALNYSKNEGPPIGAALFNRTVTVERVKGIEPSS